MAVSEKQLKYAKKYQSKFDEIKIRVPQGMKEKYKAIAEEQGRSLNQFIIDCIEKGME